MSAAVEMYDFKMVMVVRTDLGMKPGKVAAQCVHAALGANRISTSEQHFIEFMNERREVLNEMKEERDALQAEGAGSDVVNKQMPDQVSNEVSSTDIANSSEELPLPNTEFDEILRDQYFEQLSTNATIWEETGEKAVCVKCPSEDIMNELIETCCCTSTGVGNCPLPYYYVVDAGRTQIAEGSMTVLAIGPASNDVINRVTGALKLY